MYYNKYLKYKNKYLSLVYGGKLNLDYTRSDDDKNVTLKKDEILYFGDDLYTHIKLLPSYDDLINKDFFIIGGIRFGGRYPDITISSKDYEYGRYYLYEYLKIKINEITDEKILFNNIEMIIKFVRSQFKTDTILEFEEKTLTIDNEPFTFAFLSRKKWKLLDTTTTCVKNKLFECTNNVCSINEKDYQVTTTNVSLLPALLGDCREHAWLLGFLVKILLEDYKKDYKIGIFYGKCYICPTKKKTIHFLEEHVFCVLSDPKNNLTILDALYFDKSKNCFENKRIRNCFIFNNRPLKKTCNELGSYNNYDLIKGQNSYYSGASYLNGEKICDIISVPIIYNNIYSYTDKKNNMLIYNKNIDKPPEKIINSWNKFHEWCE